MPDILLIDDDRELCQLVTDYLQREGFTVRTASNGADGLHTAANAPPDLVICDVMMPGMDGLDVLRKLREISQTPVLMLTAKRTESDRISGLELGADDFVPKPFSPRELVARIRAVLRRTSAVTLDAHGSEHAVLSVGDVSIDRSRRLVSVSDADVNLTATEFELLARLLERAGETLDRRSLIQMVLGREPTPEDRALDMTVSRIRSKIGPHPDGRSRIRSIRALGYVYVMP